jgi:hypothetical protein
MAAQEIATQRWVRHRAREDSATYLRRRAALHLGSQGQDIDDPAEEHGREDHIARIEDHRL